MTRHFFAGVALSALVITPAFAQDANTVLATVNGTEITLGHVIVAQSQLPDQYRALPDDTLLQGILEQLIQQEVVATAVAEDLTGAMLIGLENERRAFLAAMALDAVGNAEVTQEDLQAAYDAQFGDVDAVMEYNASHILVETEGEAEALIGELEDGADFAEMAQTHSTGPSGPNGGLLGWFSAGMMVPTFEEAAFALEVGDISAPVETRFGWHIIILNETRDQAAPTLEEMRGELTEGLRIGRVDSYIETLTTEADIDQPELDFDPAAIRDLGLLEN